MKCRHAATLSAAWTCFLATAVVAKLTSAPAKPVEVKVDRPFLFLIRDLETGAVLFLGRVVDPSA